MMDRSEDRSRASHGFCFCSGFRVVLSWSGEVSVELEINDSSDRFRLRVLIDIAMIEWRGYELLEIFATEGVSLGGVGIDAMSRDAIYQFIPK